MKIACCDDEGVILNYLKKTLEDYFISHQETVEITSYQSSEEMLFTLSDTIPYDLVILDIQMGKMNGMDLAKEIRHRDSHIEIIFLTGDSDYVFEGYEVRALHYLLKPLKENQLYTILDHLRNKLKSNQHPFTLLMINKEMV